MMIKIGGAVCVVLGCLLPAIQYVGQEHRHVRQLAAVAESFDKIRRQLNACAPQMEEVLATAARSQEETVGNFYRSIHLEQLETRPFSDLWDQALYTSGFLLDAEELSILSGVGQILGRYDCEEQCDKLESAAAELRRCQSQRKETLCARRRLWYTLSASAGLLAVLILY